MSKNPSNERIRGTIVDETMKSFIVKTSSGEKRLIKSDCIFKIKSDNWKGTVDGKSLVGRPEERIKKK